MDDRLEKIKEHIEYLAEELARLTKERNRIDREISLVENSLKNHQALYNSRTGAYVESEKEVPGKYDGMSQVAAARRFLAEHDNKPFHASEIWAELSVHGISSKAKEPVWALATNLGLHKDFVPIGDKKATFRLTDEAYQSELEKIKKEAIEGRFPGFNDMLKIEQTRIKEL